MLVSTPQRQRPDIGWFYRVQDRLPSLRWQLLLRCLVAAVLLSTALSGILLFSNPDGFSTRYAQFHDYLAGGDEATAAVSPGGTPEPESDPAAPSNKHPIEELMADARMRQETLLAARSWDLPTAAARYRKRHGRHPPPGFDAWLQYALDHDAVVVESFFDRIYDDLAPYWALDPLVIAQRAASWHHVVRVRGGQAYPVGYTKGRVPWLKIWTALVNESAPFLPDVDMPINYMDESRLLVPWEQIDQFVQMEQATRALIPKDKAIRNFSGLETVQDDAEPYDPAWRNASYASYWDLYRATCPPGSPSRDIAAMANFEQPPTFPKNWKPEFSYRGYVRNFTASMDACLQPHLRELHSSFVQPLSMSTSTELIPLFGGSKLPGNNEILIPGAMYLTDNVLYSGGEELGPPWNQKKDGIIWRGVASGGKNTKDNWSHFHRHRLVQMLNGTTVASMEKSKTRARTFELPPLSQYNIPRQRTGRLGAWLKKFSNAGFTDLLCSPKGSDCAYVQPYYDEVDKIPMVEQYAYKFLADVDGNSFSARWRGFLRSTSLPLKATVYAEWHDARLVAWRHFVPLDNTLQDLYGVLDYFADRDAAGDEAAREIAEAGAEWAARVLRREDMLLYVWRLLLEFARVCDQKRELLGYVEDLDDVHGNGNL
ncbi:hypothetical protein PFICI_04746 [Pestalotiopsis fici W106-1]|uniref:Glycosyl transferase CAP10 domain-containing protein n=1 Tax=Pestalotiopsis fici (strain W106-1 / CGMCC3.15140) TaxID=1229662 RepID=W3X9Y6_PESFW|nr:uncharacterized protein PFICI_04746 [Pestalotiopsis fici W106-1]ETS82870.1 hypothetical protein PFICI_04746 [Pestalotiopsis fici W106-1]